MLRSWRVLLLAWAILLAPQVQFVHALSHIAPQSSEQSSHERQQAPDKVCDTCAVLAQLGSALPSQHEWHSPADALPAPVAPAVQAVALQPTAHFQARAPPALS